MNQFYSEKILNSRQFFIFYLGFGLVYLSGMFVPLMEKDSAQHASMAMRMALENDFFHIFKGDEPYLDKPHLHFWLAALSMKIFGISAFAYRIPALLCIMLAAFSTGKLSLLLYGNLEVGRIAQLVFLSAQIIILSAHDVRTDAVLTGFIIFSLWQLVSFIKTQKISVAVLAGLGMAMAFSSKGMMGVYIILMCGFSYLLYSKEWKKILNTRFLMIVFSFTVGILPVLFAYWNQFGAEGIRFIFFNQSADRITANGFRKTNTDYFFFFHTLLWAFIPFSVAFYWSLMERTLFFIRTKFKFIKGKEFLTTGGFWMVVLPFSFSKFKLPHYLNGLIPVLSVSVASWIVENRLKKNKIRILYAIQMVMVFFSIFAVLLLMVYFTGIFNVWMLIVLIVFTLILFSAIIRKNPDIASKFLSVSFLMAISVNLFLNTQFYPVLTQYQGGIKLAEYVNSHAIDKQKLYLPKDYYFFTVDFYTKKNIHRIDFDDLRDGDYLIVDENDLKYLRKPYQKITSVKNFWVSKLSLKFLNPETRNKTQGNIFLVRVIK